MAVHLVTGGAGFIGSHIAQALVRRGDTVRVLDDFSTGKRENLAEILDRIQLIEGSLDDPGALSMSVEGVDTVFHEAAIPSVPRSVDDPVASNHANVSGTLALLIAARDAEVRRVVFAASSAAYGDQPGFPRRESMPTQTLSPYAAGKVAGEAYMQAFHACYGMETVCLRYFNVFGPRQDPTSQYAAAIPRFIARLLAGERPVVYGDGEQSRDWTYVANVVHANLLAAVSPNAPGRLFNVGCGQTVSVNRIIEIVQGILGTKIEPRYEPPRPGDVLKSDADISLARELLDYEPEVRLEEGLRETIDRFRYETEK